MRGNDTARPREDLRSKIVGQGFLLEPMHISYSTKVTQPRTRLENLGIDSKTI